MGDIVKEQSLIDIENYPFNIKIDFSRFSKLSIKAKEITSCYLTGNMCPSHSCNRCNIVKSKAEYWHTSYCDMNAVDIKDCFFVDCKFNSTNFSNSSVINSNYQDTSFNNCIFNNSSITNVIFQNVTFYDCNLGHLVMENCKFYNCIFVNCITTNKLVEQSLFFNTVLDSMSIDIETITDNFGLCHELCKNVKIQDLKHHTKFIDFLDNACLKDVLNNSKLSTSEKFKIAYFLDSELLNTGGKYIDGIFNIRIWLENCRNSATFGNVMSLFFEFLSYNYEQNQIMLWPLLKFYQITSSIVSGIEPHNQYNMYSTIMGIHMAVVRYVEEYYALIQFYVSTQIDDSITLLVCSGPLDKNFYKTRLKPLFTNNQIEILKIIKHNSPNELYLKFIDVYNWLMENGLNCLNTISSVVTLYSFYLGTRKKHQVDKERNKITLKISTPQKKSISSKKSPKTKNKDTAEPVNIQIKNIDGVNPLNDSTRIQIIYQNKKNTPVTIVVENKSEVICTVGNTILDILST